MSAGIVYNDGTALTATAAGNAGEVLTSQGAGSPPIFAAVGGGTSFSIALAFDADASNITGDGTVYVLDPVTVLVNNGFTYNQPTGVITVLNTGTYFISALLELNGINETHNTCQWIVYNTITGQIGQAEPGNLLTGADQNAQFDSRLDTCLNLTSGDSFYIRFTAYGGTKTIGFSNSASFTNRITIWQIG